MRRYNALIAVIVLTLFCSSKVFAQVATQNAALDNTSLDASLSLLKKICSEFVSDGYRFKDIVLRNGDLYFIYNRNSDYDIVEKIKLENTTYNSTEDYRMISYMLSCDLETSYSKTSDSYDETYWSKRKVRKKLTECQSLWDTSKLTFILSGLNDEDPRFIEGNYNETILLTLNKLMLAHGGGNSDLKSKKFYQEVIDKSTRIFNFTLNESIEKEIPDLILESQDNGGFQVYAVDITSSPIYNTIMQGTVLSVKIASKENLLKVLGINFKNDDHGSNILNFLITKFGMPHYSKNEITQMWHQWVGNKILVNYYDYSIAAAWSGDDTPAYVVTLEYRE